MRCSLLWVFLSVFLACQKSPVSKEVQKVKDITLDNPFTRIAYDSVVAYELNTDTPMKKLPEESIVKDQKVLSDGISEKRKLLPAQVSDLIRIVGDTVTYEGYTAACFTPRLGFVFFFKGKIGAYINICFECHALTSYPYIPVDEYRTKSGSKYSFGLGDKGEKALKTLCKQLKFSHCK